MRFKYKTPKHALFFFPILLPIASFIPSVLALAGIVAAFLRKYSKNNNRKNLFLILTVVFIFASVFLTVQKKKKLEVLAQGAVLTSPDHYPRIEKLDDTITNIEPVSKNEFHLAWTKLVNDKITSNAALYDKYLLVGTEKGKVLIFDNQNGRHLYTIHKNNPILAEPYIVGDKVLLSEGAHQSTNSSLTFFDLKEMKVLWQREFLGHLEMNGILDQKNGNYYFGAGPSGVWGINLKSKQIVFHDRCGHVDASPIIKNNQLYVHCSLDSNPKQSEIAVYDLSKNGLKLRNHSKHPGDPWGVISEVKDRFVVTSGNGQIGPVSENENGFLNLFNSNLDILKVDDLYAMPLPKLVFTEKEYLVTLKKGLIQIRNQITDSIRTTIDLKSEIYSVPTYFKIKNKEYIAVVTNSGNLNIIELDNLKNIFNTDVATGSSSSVGIQNDDLYVFTPIEILKYSGLQFLYAE